LPDDGLKLHDAPLGRPPQERLTELVLPAERFTETEVEPELPFVTVIPEDTDIEEEQLAQLDAGLTVTEMEFENFPLDSSFTLKVRVPVGMLVPMRNEPLTVPELPTVTCPGLSPAIHWVALPFGVKPFPLQEKVLPMQIGLVLVETVGLALTLK